MKKLYYILILTILFFNSDTSAQSSSACIPMTFENNEITVPLIIDGTEKKMNLSFCEMSGVYVRELNFDKSSLVKRNLKCNFFESLNYSFKEVLNPNQCSNENFGTLGVDLLQKSRKIYMIDFDELKLCLIDQTNLKEALRINGFQELKSIFYTDKIEIVVSINWHDYKFTFDLGYSGTFCHIPTSNLQNIKEYSLRYNKISEDQLAKPEVVTILPFAKFYLNKVGYSSALRLDENIDNRVGLGFIKGFNWIIDYKSNKIYYKKNHTSIDSNILQKDFTCKIIGSEIIISEVRQNSRNYKVGQTITTVSGNLVNTDNICSLQSILDKSAYWEGLDLKLRD